MKLTLTGEQFMAEWATDWAIHKAYDWKRWSFRLSRRDHGFEIAVPFAWMDTGVDFRFYPWEEGGRQNYGRSQRLTLTFEYGWLRGVKDRGPDYMDDAPMLLTVEQAKQIEAALARPARVVPELLDLINKYRSA